MDLEVNIRLPHLSPNTTVHPAIGCVDSTCNEISNTRNENSENYDSGNFGNGSSRNTLFFDTSHELENGENISNKNENNLKVEGNIPLGKSHPDTQNRHSNAGMYEAPAINGNEHLYKSNEKIVKDIKVSNCRSEIKEEITSPKHGITIRIGSPVRKNIVDNKTKQSSETEYTIIISSQNNVNLHNASLTSENIYCKQDDECFPGDTLSKELTVDLPIRISEHEIQVGQQVVKLRAKKTPIRSRTPNACQSQTDEMKRHSTEISMLRQALQQKITDTNLQSKSCNDKQHMRRPLSMSGFSSLQPSPTKENRCHCGTQTHIRRSISQTSSPVNRQNNKRKAFNMYNQRRSRFSDSDQEEFDDQYNSGLYNEYKNIQNIGLRTFSPQPYHDSYSFEINNRNNHLYDHYDNHLRPSSLYDSQNNIDSCYESLPISPKLSPKQSPTRMNSKATTKTRESSKNTATPTVEEDGRINYYPNCDAAIWLRSCNKEVTEPLHGEQIGDVPPWLSGTLIRNGPGRLEVGDHKYNHLFDGSALLHRFHFKNGQVTYQNRFLRSNSYLRDTKAQRIVVNYFGTRAHPDPCKTILQNIASTFDFEEHFTDNAQISLYPYGDGLYALTETPFIFRVDPESLETHEKVDLTKYVAILTHTAHPHVDRDGTVYNIGQGVGPLGPRYHICKFPTPKSDKKGKTKTPFDQASIVGSVGARWRLNPCYMHSFAMTENYFVIIEQPLVVNVPKILKVILKQDALIDSLQWWEKETKIHVIRRDTGSTISTQYVTETFFFLHTINAYEDCGHIVLDIATYRNAEMLHCMYVEALKNASYDPSYAQMFRGRPKRWVIPLQPNKDASVGTNLVTLPDTNCQGRWLKKNLVYLTPELIVDIGCEVPRIYYEEYNGRPYRYFYAICSDVDHPNPGTLVKVDVVSKTHIEWSEDNVYPSEPVFVPHPQAKNEDDGVVLSALLRAKGLNNQVCMLILDAASFREKARVEFVAPGPVPKCLHGWFVPEGTLKVHQNDTEKANASGE